MNEIFNRYFNRNIIKYFSEMKTVHTSTTEEGKKSNE